ncbi:hypothetical protein BJY52DRAFT_1228060 [Lactarius psammicola]|nr:hypothetical protein BJY52DRAFT_1228060 [Lactarius psammicola]
MASIGGKGGQGVGSEDGAQVVSCRKEKGQKDGEGSGSGEGAEIKWTHFRPGIGSSLSACTSNSFLGNNMRVPAMRLALSMARDRTYCRSLDGLADCESIWQGERSGDRVSAADRAKAWSKQQAQGQNEGETIRKWAQLTRRRRVTNAPWKSGQPNEPLNNSQIPLPTLWGNAVRYSGYVGARNQMEVPSGGIGIRVTARTPSFESFDVGNVAVNCKDNHEVSRQRSVFMVSALLPPNASFEEFLFSTSERKLLRKLREHCQCAVIGSTAEATPSNRRSKYRHQDRRKRLGRGGRTGGWCPARESKGGGRGRLKEEGQKEGGGSSKGVARATWKIVARRWRGVSRTRDKEEKEARGVGGGEEIPLNHLDSTPKHVSWVSSLARPYQLP